MPQIIACIILAIVPVFVWGYIFYKKNPENKRSILLTFIFGALAVFPILLYKLSWQIFPWINAFKIADFYSEDVIGFTNLIVLPMSVLITFMFVGLIEEIMKFFSVKIADDDEIESVDDSMEFFIIAALGFSFIENILYFYNILITRGPNHLFFPFLFRSSFSTLAHIIFSGILGYYYGVAHFAKPILQEEIRKNRRHWTKAFHKILGVGRNRLFYQENLTEGLLISIGLHAIFNIFLEMNLTFFIVPFLLSGYLAINYLFDKKESHKNYRKVRAKVRNHPHPKSKIFFLPQKIR
jgi:RsiW-degrading membrane proteinase PrsW (M82 family)